MKVLAQGVHHDNSNRFLYQRFQETLRMTDKIKLDSTSTNKINLMNLKGSHMFDSADKNLLLPFFKNKIEPYEPYHSL